MTFSRDRQEHLVRMAMDEAAKSIESGDRPFGAVLVDPDGRVVATARNTQNSTCDESAHAEINLLRHLGRRKSRGHAVFTNASSCSMCASALIKAGVRDFYYGSTPESGMVPDLPIEKLAEFCKYPLNITGGILAAECRAQIQSSNATLIQ